MGGTGRCAGVSGNCNGLLSQLLHDLRVKNRRLILLFHANVFEHRPNTATGHSSVILATENTVNYSLKFIKPILNGEVDTYEIKEEAERAYTADIQEKLKGTVWMEGGCRSWYKKANGWNATVYP